MSGIKLPVEVVRIAGARQNFVLLAADGEILRQSWDDTLLESEAKRLNEGEPLTFSAPPKPPGPSLTLSSVRPPEGGVYLRLAWPGADAPEILIGLGLVAAAHLSSDIGAAVLQQGADILTGGTDHARG